MIKYVYTISYNMIPYHTIWYHIIQYDTISYNMIPYHTIWLGGWARVGRGLGSWEAGVWGAEAGEGGWGGGLGRGRIYHIVQYDTILYNMIPYCTIWYHIVQYGTILYDTILYNMIPYCTIWYHIVQYDTILYLTPALKKLWPRALFPEWWWDGRIRNTFGIIL